MGQVGCFPHFTDVETEAKRVKVRFPRSHPKGQGQELDLHQNQTCIKVCVLNQRL